jgi:signal transduction histidine kinase
MLKYGAITKCDLLIVDSGDNMVLEIVDDGKPFDFKKLVLESKGAGLSNIDSRLKVISATLEQKNVEYGNHFIIKLKK